MQKIQPDYVLLADVSNNNKNLNMSTWPSWGVKGVYIKASEGNDYIDAYMSANNEMARANHMATGLYHYGRPSRNTAQAEAELLVSLLKGQATDLDPALDLEDLDFKGPGEELTQWMLDFAKYVKEHDGREILVYTAKWYIDLFPGFDLCGLRLWNSWYPEEFVDPMTVSPPDFAGRYEYAMWQFTETGFVGTNGRPIDLNYAVSLEALGYRAPAAVPQTNYLLSAEDADKIINLLGGVWQAGLGQDEAHRIANVIRRCAGLTTT